MAGGALIGTVTGSQIIGALDGAITPGVSNVDVTINTDGTAFSQVIASDTGANAFEFVKAAVPEPTSMAILGAALAGFGVLRRRRKTT
jgi:hypothetical protein